MWTIRVVLAHQSGFLFRVAGSVSVSQNIVVAVKAVDPVEIKTETMAAVPLSLALSRTMSCKISLRR